TPADETPADETPADETPADETPADETPADETPADETPAHETPADETPADETPADETPADDEDVPVVSDPVVYTYVPVFVPTDESIDFISVVPTDDDQPDLTVETTDKVTVSDAAPVLVVESLEGANEDDTTSTTPDDLYSFDENDVPLGDFFFEENKIPLGGFEDVDSSVKNPNTGVASPVAMGAAAIASLALAFGSRKKRK
ncbi:MAG: LPXTG cell wall anchor domain-containing protein, partial [Ruminiclostridium sp.]|nr:LPXTG cell wall anchor domain-containing protein [Ruminiclostridium sp.]